MTPTITPSSGRESRRGHDRNTVPGAELGSDPVPGARPAQRHPRGAGAGLLRYERRKAEYIAEHPEATPAEYSKAMTRLARDCGV